MSQSTAKPTTPANAPSAGWSLEVVRGRDVGRSYAIEPGETIVGNAKHGARGLDLLDQEGNSPRKMAARHATLESTAAGLSIRDLESPGGTFVNQQRLLSGHARKLQPGDVIQLGSVQLRVKQAAAAATSAAAPTRAETVKAAAKPAAAAASPTAASHVPIAGPPPGHATVAAKGRVPVPAPEPIPSPAKPPVPAAAAAPVPPVAGRLASPFAMVDGARCRTWDDFLVQAAGDWQALRDEMTSGRLADYLRRIHRPDLVPHAGSHRSADDQLDEWLARIPATQSSAPELDVHPETVLVQSKTGGGIAHQSLRVTNVGYRLLRCTARVEPAEARWVRLRPEHNGQPFLTIDQTELPIELELPETIDRPLRALIVIESNGGTRRIEVRIERPTDQVVLPEAGGGAVFSAASAWTKRMSQSMARLSSPVRIAACCAGAVALRLLVLIPNALPFTGAGAALVAPRLFSFAIVLVAVGVLAGLALARATGERRDLPAAGFAGGALGLLAAAVWFAAVSSVERALGSWASSIGAVALLWGLVERVLGSSASSIGAVALLWGLIGALVALATIYLIPYRRDDRGAVR
jgi:hypothetical protein